MLFLTPNQQCQSTEGNKYHIINKSRMCWASTEQWQSIDLPDILSAAFQHVNLSYDLPLFVQPEILHPQLMLQTVDGFGNLCLAFVLQTRLQMGALSLLCTKPHEHNRVILTLMKIIPPHHHNRFTALFLQLPSEPVPEEKLLDFMVQGKINRGRHTDHPAGRHSIRTNQCPPPPSPL